MKLVYRKTIEIFTDGSLNFSYKSFEQQKQVVVYEKDHKSSSFFKKQKKISHYNLSNTFYKTKYKI